MREKLITNSVVQHKSPYYLKIFALLSPLSWCFSFSRCSAHCMAHLLNAIDGYVSADSFTKGTMEMCANYSVTQWVWILEIGSSHIPMGWEEERNRCPNVCRLVFIASMTWKNNGFTSWQQKVPNNLWHLNASCFFACVLIVSIRRTLRKCGQSTFPFIGHILDKYMDHVFILTVDCGRVNGCFHRKRNPITAKTVVWQCVNYIVRDSKRKQINRRKQQVRTRNINKLIKYFGCLKYCLLLFRSLKS